ncbi:MULTISPECIES: GNAT family N-acetyltransferase [unclassified Exiguobacterium]|uniref:GNAT family N-acetyltransferase n=1 Tax=unclassified Exiguobacterium TaxID=2644629 RepID=UPI001EF01A0D|nr:MULTISPECIES: GNAT family N-acetyltransferase [unclassified Exiguobacterium]
MSLFEQDCATRPAYTPWLASLYTDPTYRGQGIAEKLIESLLALAIEFGHSTVYLRTDNATDYYLARGWLHVETTESGLDICKRDILNQSLE